MSNKKSCFQCGMNGVDMYGYIVCDLCVSNLRLFTDATLKKHVKKYKNPIYKKIIDDRLILIDKSYIKKKIKLLNIQERLKNIQQ